MDLYQLIEKLAEAARCGCSDVIIEIEDRHKIKRLNIDSVFINNSVVISCKPNDNLKSLTDI